MNAMTTQGWKKCISELYLLQTGEKILSLVWVQVGAKVDPLLNLTPPRHEELSCS
jgi:hypothetical protein